MEKLEESQAQFPGNYFLKEWEKEHSRVTNDAKLSQEMLKLESLVDSSRPSGHTFTFMCPVSWERLPVVLRDSRVVSVRHFLEKIRNRNYAL